MLNNSQSTQANVFRRAAEFVSRRLVFRRNLPREFGGGQIFVSPESGLKFYRKDIGKTDPTLFRMVAELVRPGDVVWDIGANFGLFSFAAAAIAGPQGRVFSLEPDTWLVDLVRRSSGLQAPGHAKVTPIPAAVSDSVGLTQLHIAARSRSSNFIVEGNESTQAGGTRTTQCVAAVTLDFLLGHLLPPQVLKIDVEGVEDRVLAGASRLLTEIRPRIWCEVSEKNSERVTQLLRKADYILFDANQNSSNRQPLPDAVWDTLALPNTCASRMAG